MQGGENNRSPQKEGKAQEQHKKGGIPNSSFKSWRAKTRRKKLKPNSGAGMIREQVWRHIGWLPVGGSSACLWCGNGGGAASQPVSGNKEERVWWLLFVSSHFHFQARKTQRV